MHHSAGIRDSQSVISLTTRCFPQIHDQHVNLRLTGSICGWERILEVPEMSSFVIETAGHFYHELPGQDFIMGSSWGTSIRWAFTMWNLKPSGNYLLIKDYGRFDRSLQIHGSIVITFHNIGLSVNHWILPISLGTSLYDRCPEKEGREGWQMDGSCLIIIAVHHSVTTFSRILSLPVQLLDRK